jgi:hypothetical protein
MENEIPSERLDVIGTLPQRLQENRDDVQPIK